MPVYLPDFRANTLLYKVRKFISEVNQLLTFLKGIYRNLNCLVCR